MKKKYLRKNVERVLVALELLIISFVIMTIDNIGNNVYNEMLIITMIIFIINLIVLVKHSKAFNN